MKRLFLFIAHFVVMTSCVSQGVPGEARDKLVYMELEEVVDGNQRHVDGANGNGGRIVLDLQQRTFTRRGITGPLHLCEDDSPYWCVKDPVLPFAVPNEQSFAEDNWVVGSSEYRVTDRKKEIRLGTERLTVLEIVSDQESGMPTVDAPLRYTFYYSPNRGLVAFHARIVGCEAIPPDPDQFIEDFCELGGYYAILGNHGLFAGGETR